MRERTYPPGVPCWIDTEQPDLDAAARFYGGLFGWTFADVGPGSYVVAQVDGQDVAGLAPVDGARLARNDDGPAWHTYIAAEDAEATVDAAVAAGATVVETPFDAGQGGRAAACIDPVGARFRLWQPGRRAGAQRVNAAGSWNFSNLRTTDPKTAMAFYGSVFGWVVDDAAEGAWAMVRVPGYGDHLEATVDPDIRRRQAGAPPGFADVIGGIEAAGPDEPAHWLVKFTVVDRDESAAIAERLGAVVVSTSQTQWTREAVLRDPQGAEFSVSQFTPPE
jgi:predicted enzyme related to lactoylglutathione lyase